MNLLQRIISSTYSFRMKTARITGLGIQVYENKNHIKPIMDFYSLKAYNNAGEAINFNIYKGKKVLIVNLASQCGYTPQYEGLENLFLQHKELIVLGFPANNFGQQEPGTDHEIAEFCKLNFGVTFPLFKKDDVKGESKQPVYQWLSDKKKNGWNDIEPEWNFYKYLIDESGVLLKVASSSVSPEDFLK
ncbi:MAG: glutathione peroxidase [Ginsengibacter sp.]